MTGRRRLYGMPRSILGTLALALLAVVALAAPARADLKVGDRVKELDIATDVAGKPFKLKALGGWRFVSANAAWCEPCKKELPQWDKLQAALGGKITFVALSLTIVLMFFLHQLQQSQEDLVHDTDQWIDQRLIRHMQVR